MSTLFAILTGLGVGTGGLYILYLTEIQNLAQKQAQGVNLLFFFACILSASLFNLLKKRILKKSLFPLILFGTLSCALTPYVLQGVKVEVLNKLFGIFLVLLGSIGLFSGKK